MDQAILNEESRVIVVRFGHDWDPTCMVSLIINWMSLMINCIQIVISTFVNSVRKWMKYCSA